MLAGAVSLPRVEHEPGGSVRHREAHVTHGLSALSVACLLAVAPMVGAQDAVDAGAEDDFEQRARGHFTVGRELVSVGRHAEARAEFEAGHALSGRPLFLFNMAECAFALGRTSEAREEYQRYLRDDPEGAGAHTARARLEALGPEPEITLPASQPEVSPERVDLEVVHSAPPAALAPAPARSTSTRSTRAWYARWPLWTVVGIVVVASVVGLGVGLTRAGGPTCGTGCMTIDWRGAR